MDEKKDNSEIESEPVNENAEAANEKRTVKLTETVVDAQLTKLINARKAKLGKLSSKRNCIEPLLIDYINIKEVQRLKSVFDHLISEFTTLHYSTQEMMSEEEKQGDHNDWYFPKLRCFKDFQDAVKKWLIKASAYIEDIP